MRTVEVKFDHEADDLHKACGVEESQAFIMKTIKETYEKIKADNYTYSNALEDIIKETRKHFGIKLKDTHIWNDDVLTVLIAYRLGELIGMEKTMGTEASKMLKAATDILESLGISKDKFGKGE